MCIIGLTLKGYAPASTTVATTLLTF